MSRAGAPRRTQTDIFQQAKLSAGTVSREKRECGKFSHWWTRGDLNPQPDGYQSSALPIELRAREPPAKPSVSNIKDTCKASVF